MIPVGRHVDIKSRVGMSKDSFHGPVFDPVHFLGSHLRRGFTGPGFRGGFHVSFDVLFEFVPFLCRSGIGLDPRFL